MVTNIETGQVARLAIGEVTLTRVPYFDIPLGPDAVGLGVDDVRAVPWAVPRWADAGGNVIVGQAVWVIESGRSAMVVDPCGAADDFLRTGAEARVHQEKVLAAMRECGLPAERIDIVVLTHLDGIGMAAAVDERNEWVAMFPNARVVMTRAELDYLASDPPTSGLVALRQLIEHGIVESVENPYELAGGVTLELTAAHTPGHAVVRVRSGADEAVILGHLAVSPVHLATGPCAALNQEPNRAADVLDNLVAAARRDGSILVGPLWPYPGAVRVDSGGAVIAVDGVG